MLQSLLNKIKYFLLIGFGCLLLHSAKADFVFDKPQADIYREIFNLRLSLAKELLVADNNQNPKNQVLSLLSAYIDFAEVFISENPSRFKAYKIANQNRLKSLENQDDKNPWKRYIEAEILLHQALARAKFGEYPSAVIDFQKAHKLIKKNSNLFPNFLLNTKSQGVFLIILSTVPGDYKWALRILGLEGNLEQGTDDLNIFLKEAPNTPFEPFAIETRMLLAFFTLNMAKKPNEAWQLLNHNDINPNKSLMAVYTLSTIAKESGRNDYAIKLLSQRPHSADFTSFPFLDYLLANCFLHKLQFVDAELYFNKFLKDFSGKNLVKDSHMRLAWIALLQNNIGLYQTRKSIAMKAGSQVVDEDKQAHHQLISTNNPNVTILQARLLFDGGYYKEAERVLDKIDTTTLNQTLQTEYAYRLARVYHESNQSEKAILTYLFAIRNGEKLPEYYAAASCLQLGYLYEARNDKWLALFFFNRSMSFSNHAYKNSLGQKAKAGIKRVS